MIGSVNRPAINFYLRRTSYADNKIEVDRRWFGCLGHLTCTAFIKFNQKCNARADVVRLLLALEGGRQQLMRNDISAGKRSKARQKQAN